MQSDKTILKFVFNTGALDNFWGTRHAAHIILHNYYNSYDLARQLLERDILYTKTLRIDRKKKNTQKI